MKFGNGRPNDERGFIHKTILGGISRFASVLPIPGAGFVSAVTGKLSRGGRPTPPRTATARVTSFSTAQRQLGQSLKFPGFGGGDGACVLPARRDPRTGECRVFLGEQSGRDDVLVGEAVMGRYGAALEPGSMVIDRAVCLRGMQLGDDGLCYNKSQISNKQRKWPRGRRPLLSGGDMRAIGIAARAGARLDKTSTRLRGLGMMKALPKARGRKKLPVGHHAHTAHD